MFGEEIDGAIGAAMRVAHLGGPGGIGACGGLAAAKAVCGRELLQVGSHVVPVMRVPSRLRNSGVEVVCSGQVPFADKGAVNPLITESLASRVRNVSDLHAVSPHSIGVGIEACPECGARRRTNRLAVIGALETHSLRGKSIQIPRLQACRTIAVEHVIADRFTAEDNHLLRRTSGMLLLRWYKPTGRRGHADSAHCFHKFSTVHKQMVSVRSGLKTNTDQMVDELHS